MVILVLEERPLLRECIVAAFNQRAQVHAVAAANAGDYRARASEFPKPGVVLICVPEGARLSSASGMNEAETDFGVPAVVSSNDRPAAEVLVLLEAGIRGFIPNSVAVDVAVQALRLVQAGGTFVPESSLRLVSSTEPSQAERSGPVYSQAAADSRGHSAREAQQDHRLRTRNVREHGEGACADNSEEAEGKKPHSDRLPLFNRHH
jgi:DNA-binding NarL/FixJ family response regulator